MLKEHWRTVSRLEKVGDTLLVIVSFFFAYYGRDSLFFWSSALRLDIPFGGPALAPISDYALVLLIGIVSFLSSLHGLGAYTSMRLRTSWQLLRASMASAVFTFLILSATLFLLKLDLSRSFLILFCSLTGALLTLERYLALEFLRFWRKRGKNFRNLLIAGVGEQAERLALEVWHRPELGLRVRGFADLSMLDSDMREPLYARFKERLSRLGFSGNVRIIRGAAGVKSALSSYAVDEVIFTDIIDVLPQVRDLVFTCAEQGVRTTLAADLFSFGMVHSELSFFGDMPLIHFQTPPGDRWDLGIKRLIDVLLSALLLLVFSPIFLVLALAIKISSPGPVFFVQRRVGQNGRSFPLYKFRSMEAGAEQKLDDLMVHNEMEGPVFKMTNDPRVTSVGKFLRRFSLDELPQLWCVLVGDMSLVGPRPPVPGEVSLYERSDRRRLSMRPGITCTWQVSGRNEIADFESWVKMDLDYIDNWSLGRDLELLLRTIPAVLFGRGAR